MEKVGLVLEGGGMRGVYTAGVLDLFMENNLYFSYIIGVSAGACNASSYISRQIGRNKRVNINYIDNPNYLSIRNLVKEKSLFGMNFLFEEIPLNLEPFDFRAYYNNTDKFVIGATDCVSGKALYFDKGSCQRESMDLIRASSSLPFVSPIVYYQGYNLLDGGIADPIPIRKSFEDGNHKNVVILTRNKDYRKKPFKLKWLAKAIYPQYENLVKAMEMRSQVYNETLELIERLEKEGKVFVIRPQEKLEVDRLEKNPQKLTKLFDMGYENANNLYPYLKSWLEA